MEAELARVGDRERLAPADRRLHGRPLHGRDAGHELRPRRHDRRGQGGHGRPRRSRASPRPGSPSPRRSPRSPTSSGRRSRERSAAHEERRHRSSASRSTTRVRGDAELAAKLDRGLPGRHLRRRPTARVEIVEENLDECVLCELCIDAAPPGRSGCTSSTRTARSSIPDGWAERGPRWRRRIALTFDDGPGDATPAVLDVLAEHEAPRPSSSSAARSPGAKRRRCSARWPTATRWATTRGAMPISPANPPAPPTSCSAAERGAGGRDRTTAERVPAAAGRWTPSVLDQAAEEGPCSVTGTSTRARLRGRRDQRGAHHHPLSSTTPAAARSSCSTTAVPAREDRSWRRCPVSSPACATAACSRSPSRSCLGLA